jgi:hypothetical protein
MRTGSLQTAGVLLVAIVAVGSVLAVPDLLPPGAVQAYQPYYAYACYLASGGRDFNGNGIEGADLAGLPHWNPATGFWFKSNQGTDLVWGAWGDIPAPGDFDGDGADDVAVFRPSNGTWYVQYTAGGTVTFPFGTAGDLPVPADFNNDGRTDYGVWRPSTGQWFVVSGDRSTTLVNGVAWGVYGDCPIASRLVGGGAGELQLNVWRPSNGTWYLGRSLAGAGGQTVVYGAYGDIPFGLDLDSDGDGDLLVWRPSTGTWYSPEPAFAVAWGQAGDIPAPRSGSTAQTPALSVYRPTTGMSYSCYSPAGAGCASTSSNGPAGSPGVLPLPGFSK